MGVLSRTQVIPLDDYPSGTQRIEFPGNIDNAATAFVMEIQRCTPANPDIWPNSATRIDFQLEVSFDHGQTWEGTAGTGSSGGMRPNTREGGYHENLALMFPLRPGTNRRLAIVVTITNGPLRTAGTLELRSA